MIKLNSKMLTTGTFEALVYWFLSTIRPFLR